MTFFTMVALPVTLILISSKFEKKKMDMFLLNAGINCYFVLRILYENFTIYNVLGSIVIFALIASQPPSFEKMELYSKIPRSTYIKSIEI
jgi:hypothetical protein